MVCSHRSSCHSIFVGFIRRKERVCVVCVYFLDNVWISVAKAKEITPFMYVPV